MSKTGQELFAMAEAMRKAAKAMDFLTRHVQRPSKHRAGHVGQLCKAKAKRRGTWGKAVRRRQLAARRELVAARSATVRGRG